jgi:nucleotide-binding universal stress UspA family protein
MFEKILVCLDGSALAEQILPYAIEEAIRFRSKVVLLQIVEAHTVPVVEAGASALAVEASAQQIEKEQRDVKAYLEALTQSLLEKGVDAEYVTLQGVQIGQTIVDYAKQNEVNLIAIATHGRSGLKRLVLGSVAEFVLRESGLPILLIRPKESSA